MSTEPTSRFMLGTRFIPTRTNPPVPKSIEASSETEDMYAMFKEKVLEIKANPEFQADPKKHVALLAEKLDGICVLPDGLVLSYFQRTVLGKTDNTFDMDELGGRRYSFDEIK